MTASSAGLRRRLSWVVFAISAASVGALALSAWGVHQWIEETVLETSLNQELDFLIERNVPPDDINPRGDSLQYFRPARSERWRVPTELLALSGGGHHAARIGDRRYHVMVRELAPGDRAYLAYDVEELERREESLFLILGAGILVVLVLAALLSRYAVDMGLRPLRMLVSHIAKLDPERGGERVALQTHDRDLQPIVQVLNTHLSALDHVVERERAFAAAASHELRTPLAVISSTAELHAEQPQAVTAACEKIRRASKDATELLDALLLLSQARVMPAPEPLDLAQLLPRVLEPLAGEAQRRQVQLDWQVQGAVSWAGHAGVATVVVGNLLRNALQAVSGGAVRLVMQPGSIRVEDQGPGLDPAAADRLFEPGVSVRSGGSGMGLYIARVLARRYGGDIRLDPGRPCGVIATWDFGRGV